MSKVVIGKSSKHNVHLDVDSLLRTRLLIQGNSGRGKSWLLRRLCEELFGKVQIIIIDPEGEFATLREKFGYVLVGKGGETPADPRSAALVAHKLLELRASAICDLYEMKPFARHEWVRNFCEALIDAPKNLWHPCVVIIDESHTFAPEKGAGESVASESVIGLATRGRKRGYALILATQRLGKLRKDAAAELLNVMIGGTFIDIDRKRAADALGVYGKDQHDFFDKIKLLKRGLFFALGPAISDERILVEIGSVQTTHPEAGSSKHGSEPPPAPEAIAKFLPKLSDLPKAAEEKAKTEAEYKAQIRQLKTDNTILQTKVASRDAAMSKPTHVDAGYVRQMEREFNNQLVTIHGDRKKLLASGSRLAKALKDMAEAAAQQFSLQEIKEPRIETPKAFKELTQNSRAPFISLPNGRVPILPRPVPNVALDNNDVSLRPGAKRMLSAAAMYYPNGITEGQMAAQAGVKRSGGSFSSYKSNLKTNGFLTENNGLYHATESGMAYLGEVPSSPQSTDEVLSVWLPKLRPGAQRMLESLIRANGEPMTYEELSENSGVTHEGGSFSSYLSNLRTSGLILDAGKRTVKANRETLFL